MDDSERVPPDETEDDVDNDYRTIDEMIARITAMIPPQHQYPFRKMSYYDIRLKSFKNWPSTFISSVLMAKAGFYFTGIQDRVNCLFCPYEFKHWRDGDDPYIEHRLISPQCHYFKAQQDNMSDHKSNFMKTYIQHFLRSVGIVTYKNMKVIKNSIALTSLESHMKTFDKYTEILYKDILTYCEAGLFYFGDGKNDRMIFFCCNQGLMDWGVNDDPWVEHARWSPLCRYVLLSKGKRFVETIDGVVNNSLQINLEELSELITIHRHFAVEGDTDGRNWESFAKSNTFMDFVEPEKILLGNRQESKPDALPDSVLCKICIKEKLEVLFMPCGHVVACIQCAVTLNQCVVCRRPFTMAMRIGIYANKPKEISLDNFPPECSNEPIDPIVCRICCKEQMQTVCIPCRHIVTCNKCASNEKQCLLCLEPVHAYMQVFL